MLVLGTVQRGSAPARSHSLVCPAPGAAPAPQLLTATSPSAVPVTAHLLHRWMGASRLTRAAAVILLLE